MNDEITQKWFDTEFYLEELTKEEQLDFINAYLKPYIQEVRGMK